MYPRSIQQKIKGLFCNHHFKDSGKAIGVHMGIPTAVCEKCAYFICNSDVEVVVKASEIVHGVESEID